VVRFNHGQQKVLQMSEPFLTVEADMKPMAKGRPRMARINGKVRLYTPKSTVTYERELAIMAHIEMEHRPPLEAPCKLLLEATFVPRNSLSKVKREALMDGPCVLKKDGDNLLKAVKDALNGIVYMDDRFVTDARVIKRYGIKEHVRVTVWTL
jgi:Holliday junction resolvase RusA-like endonuclease